MKAWEALKALQEGKKVRRNGYYYLYLDGSMIVDESGYDTHIISKQDLDADDWEIYNEPKQEVKVGQIWENKVYGNVFCITRISGTYIETVQKDGSVSIWFFLNFKNSSDLNLIAEYPTWEQAVNSKEWKDGK